jgi:nicotinamidase-related amidase
VLPELPALPRAPTVLLLVDLINPLQFEGADRLAAPALRAATAVAALKRDAATRGVPAIYVNDNFGLWHSDFRGLCDACLRLKGAAAALVRLLPPQAHDFTVLKPRHSGMPRRCRCCSNRWGRNDWW